MMDGDLQRKYNLKSPAVKRLMREAMELRESTEQYSAQPLDDNLFEWHFTVRGPPESEFENGCYHGRIILPPEYPMKPPSIMLLTPNGRFETGKKICLSMSAHHPETWQPSWSIRTVLLAIIGFMPTKGAGAIGALDYTHKERKVLANKSLEWKCDVCNVPNKATLLEVDHSKDEQVKIKKEAQEIAAQMSFKGEPEKNKANQTSSQQPVDQSQTSQPNSPQSSNEFSYMADPNNPQSSPSINPYLYNPYLANMYNTSQLIAPGTNAPPGTPPNDNVNFPNQNTGSKSQETGSKSNVESNEKSNDIKVAADGQGNTVGAEINQQTEDGASSGPQDGLRQRRTNASSENASSNASSSTARTRAVAQQSDPGYCSLILLWIVAAALVVLVLRRLCMDTIKIPQG